MLVLKDNYCMVECTIMLKFCYSISINRCLLDSQINKLCFKDPFSIPIGKSPNLCSAHQYPMARSIINILKLEDFLRNVCVHRILCQPGKNAIYQYKRKTWKGEMIIQFKKKGTYGTYLTHVCRHRLSVQNMVKRWIFQPTLTSVSCRS